MYNDSVYCTRKCSGKNLKDYTCFYTEVKNNTKKRFYSFDIGLAVCVGKIVPYLLRSAGGVLISLTSALSPQVDPVADPDFGIVGAKPPLPSPFPPLLPFLSPPLPFPPFPLEVGPINPARGSGEHCKLQQRGLGRSPSQNRIWCISTLKYDIWWQQFECFS